MAMDKARSRKRICRCSAGDARPRRGSCTAGDERAERPTPGGGRRARRLSVVVIAERGGLDRSGLTVVDECRPAPRPRTTRRCALLRTTVLLGRVHPRARADAVLGDEVAAGRRDPAARAGRGHDYEIEVHGRARAEYFCPADLARLTSRAKIQQLLARAACRVRSYHRGRRARGLPPRARRHAVPPPSRSNTIPRHDPDQPRPVPMAAKAVGMSFEEPAASASRAWASNAHARAARRCRAFRHPRQDHRSRPGAPPSRCPVWPNSRRPTRAQSCCSSPSRSLVVAPGAVLLRSGASAGAVRRRTRLQPQVKKRADPPSARCSKSVDQHRRARSPGSCSRSRS